AQQRFRADHRIVRQANLGLEVELELVLREGAPELEVEAPPRLRLRAQDRQEETADAPAGRFRLVEREVGVGDQFLDFVAVVASARAPRVAFDVQPVLFDRLRLEKPPQHRIDDLADDARVAAVREYDDEFIAAEPAHQTDVAANLRHADQALADLD